MSILCDSDIRRLCNLGLVDKFDESYLNPASLDIRIGNNFLRETGHGNWEKITVPDGKFLVVDPGDFILAETFESFRVPNGYAMDLRLKSSTARRGWDHSLAFWVDPGWEGVLTMEIRNVLQFNALRLTPGQRFAQVIVHRLSGPSESPYRGKYKGASGVEGPKD